MNEIAIIKDVFSTLYLYQSKMTTGQQEFVASCRNQFEKNKTLSEKQFKCISELKKHLQESSKVEPRYSLKTT